MMELAERLIKAGVLYADDTPVDQMREVRHGALWWSSEIVSKLAGDRL
jgi:hypothetical protein